MWVRDNSNSSWIIGILDAITSPSNNLTDIEVSISSSYDGQAYGHTELLDNLLIKVSISSLKMYTITPPMIIQKMILPMVIEFWLKPGFRFPE